MVEIEEEDWLQKEVFDFDCGIDKIVKSPTLDEVWLSDEGDVEDEIFIGPVTHFERCAVKAVERLTPNGVANKPETSCEDNRGLDAILYSVSKYTFKQNSPVAVVHPMCKDNKELSETENKENYNPTPVPCVKEGKEEKSTDTKKKVQCENKKSRLKAPSCLPSLIPGPGKLKLVPPKATVLKPLKAVCPTVSSNKAQIPQPITGSRKGDARPKVNATPLMTTQLSKLPGSVGIKGKQSGMQQGTTPSRRRSTGGGLRRPSSSVSKAGSATPRSESLTNPIVPRTLIKGEETPTMSGKVSEGTRPAQRSIRKSSIPSNSKVPKTLSSIPRMSKDDVSIENDSGLPSVNTISTEDRLVVSNEEDKTKEEAPVLATGSIASPILSPVTTSVTKTTEKSEPAIVTINIDEVLKVDEPSELLSQPLVDTKEPRSPDEKLLLDINKACINSPLIKFSPPLSNGPADPFKTGSTPVQNTTETELLLPALAEENPINVDLIEF